MMLMMLMIMFIVTADISLEISASTAMRGRNVVVVMTLVAGIS